jgi:hypothetical protein
MDKTTFIKRLHDDYMSRDGTMVIFAAPYVGEKVEENFAAGILLVYDHLGTRVLFDSERWKANEPTKVHNHHTVPGVSFIYADRDYGKTEEAYPFFREQLVPCDDAEVGLPEEASFHSDMWVRADG